MMKISFEYETNEDLIKFRDLLDRMIGDKKTKSRSEINHQNYLNRKMKQSESGLTQSEKSLNSNKEEREEKEEILPLSSPSSLLSSPSDSPNIYPITPYNPPLSEEREEREENIFGGSDGKRGELKSFGPHVRLSEKEFLKLKEDFGYEETIRMIRSMNDYIGEDPKLINKYRTRNHNLTLRNWKRKDAEEKKAKVIIQEKPKEKSFHDIAVERGLVPDIAPKTDFVDAFWRN